MTSSLARVLVASLVIAVAACGPRPAHVERPEWRTIGELAQPRAFASAVALGNGKILVVGGLNNDDPAVMNYGSELVDPLTGKATSLPQRLLGRLHQTITLARDDVVVVAGGVEWMQTYWSSVNRVDVFLPSLGRWELGEPLGHARSDHAATALHDGRVLVTGGNEDARLLRTAEIYEPRTGRWVEAAPMPRPRTQHRAVTMIDGRVLVTGGIDSNGATTATTFMYDPGTDSWSDGPPLTIARLQHVMVGLPSGDILLAGGDGPASGTSERYDFAKAQFVASGTLGTPRLAAQAVALSDGRVVLSGGLPPRVREFTPLRSAELWDPASGRWTDLPPAPTPRAWGTIVVVNGVVYQLSGTGDAEAAYGTIERLDLK